MQCGRCGAEVELTDEEWFALCQEHELTSEDALVIGVLCAPCRAAFLAWLGNEGKRVL